MRSADPEAKVTDDRMLSSVRAPTGVPSAAVSEPKPALVASTRVVGVETGAVRSFAPQALGSELIVNARDPPPRSALPSKVVVSIDAPLRVTPATYFLPEDAPGAVTVRRLSPRCTVALSNSGVPIV